jgi:hypothetical protein
MAQKPQFFYGTRKRISNIHQIEQFVLNEGSIFLSDAQSDFGEGAWPSGYIYRFNIKPIPKAQKFIRDTSEIDVLKVKELIRKAPTYEATVQRMGSEDLILKIAMAYSRQGAVYKYIYNQMYAKHEHEYAKVMQELGWVGFAFKVSEPDLIGGGPARLVKVVARIWNPDYLELVSEQEWDVFLSQMARDRN